MRRLTAALAGAALAVCVGACGAAGPEATGSAGTPATTTPVAVVAAPGRTTATPSAPAVPCRPARPAPVEQTGTVGGAAGGRPYRLQLPSSYDGTTPVPLLIDLHGAASNGTQQMVYSALARRGAARGYAVVVPDGSSVLGWNFFRAADQPDDVAVLETLWRELRDRLCVIPDRVFVAGLSAGAAFADVLACRSALPVAAVAFVAATLPPEGCPPDRRLPVIAFHGTDDPIVPYRGGPVNALAARGVDAPPAEQAIADWARQDGCDPRPQVDQSRRDVRRLVFACPSGDPVELYALSGAGHTWPGSPVDLASVGLGLFGATNHDVDATALVLDAFDTARGRPTGDR